MNRMGSGGPAHWYLRTTARLRVCALLLTAHCALAVVGHAQTPAPAPSRPSALVRYGKWVALGMAAGFTYLGAATHRRADRDYDALLDYCRGGGLCPVGADGRYTDPAAEALYARVRNADRSARAWLVGGQVALLASATLFIVELKHGSEPRNIPFAPYVAAGRFGTRVGLRVRWR
jgi:hypothetical protein